jgi:ElaA protein
MIQWQWKTFDELSTDNLYEILKVRQAVFSVEQDCVYQDVDDSDKTAWHLMAWDLSDSDTPSIHAYLRVVFPAYKYREPSIGRVLTVMQARGTGLGKELLMKALLNIEKEYPGQSVRISAQQYLRKFYAGYGFEQVSEPYDEDGILHIEMVKK